MSLLTQSATRHSSDRISGWRVRVDRYFYFGMSLIIAFVTIYGFSQTINTNLLHPAIARPLLLWVHGAAFAAWVALFIIQSSLVRTRHVRLHRSLGWFVAGLGAVMVPLGFAIAVIMGRFHIHQLRDRASAIEASLILSFYDMVAFAIVFVLAFAWRRKSDLHRRLMFVATCGLTSAAFTRFPVAAIQHEYTYICVDALIVLGILRDLLVNHRIHKAYLYALPILAISQGLTMYVVQNSVAWWMRIAHAILA
jgi:hypothetical protein